MKKILIITLVVLFSYSAKADLGFGLILGEPTGITLKSRTGTSNDLIFNLGLRSHYGGVRFDGIYTFNFPNAFNSRDFELYAGIGAVVATGDGHSFFYDDDDHDHDNLNIGLKGLFGLNFKASRKFEIFLELGPLIGITNGEGADMEGAIGFRFYP